jgi:hypothetical protein
LGESSYEDAMKAIATAEAEGKNQSQMWNSEALKDIDNDPNRMGPCGKASC